MTIGERKLWAGAGFFFALWFVTWLWFAIEWIDYDAERLTFIGLSLGSALIGHYCFKRGSGI
jgi:hypothetical protein